MASGDTLLIFDLPPRDWPSSSFATIDKAGDRTVLDFPSGTQTSALFRSIMPRNYGANGITVCIHWQAATATSGSCLWDVQFERCQPGSSNMIQDNFGTAKSVQAVPPGSAGFYSISTIAFAQSDLPGIVDGESFGLKIYRDGTNAGDTMTGIAQLHRIEVRET